jgi:alpha,alpha-trehalase
MLRVISQHKQLDALGKTHSRKLSTLLDKILEKKDQTKQRKEIFTYILAFWENGIVKVPYKTETYRGINLAKRPFLAPSIPTNPKDFGFYEQYRWDTYFHNLAFNLIGQYHISINQLLNFVDVYQEYKRIPNALITTYLSHAQPPLEAAAVEDILKYKKVDNNIKKIIKMIESELFQEWLDAGQSIRFLRQSDQILEKYGCLSRYTSIHHDPLLAGCEDGKDHNWITTVYGADYLPVQLNAILYGSVDFLYRYFSDKTLGNNSKKSAFYLHLKNRIYKDFQKTFWVDSGRWKGFRNYSIRKSNEGSILYGDLAAEIFPLFAGLATKEQAEITKDNLEKYYKGENGLTTTSLELRKGGTIPKQPLRYTSFQWEYPNCWAPLMYIACEGLKKYGYVNEALAYEKSWVSFIEKSFEKTQSFPEKTSFDSNKSINGGLYGEVQGFGWTIAVYLCFLKDLSNARLI